MDKRFTGFIKIKRECTDRPLTTEFDMIFSFQMESTEKDTAKIVSINPYQIKKLLKKGSRLSILFPERDSLYVKDAVVVNEGEDHITVQFIQSGSTEEKRRFYRFHFCCEDLGHFNVKKENRLLTDTGCIYEISESGMGIYLIFVGDNIKKGDILEVESQQENLLFKIEVVHIESKDMYNVVGGRVIDSNVNLINYIIRKYIKVSEKIIFEG
ncbi:PilZ domain-containing protein [Persephonella atlantica]|uniref:PilZ domain-containing protein n=1 Tax=Persephonella atlantica TaxID=2699429 RepID=A0ABS1GI13_9AQUI|nr:PilZ domain-containing protein [Persephonella atlantica]MBK3332490.1 PilZ domain-containing protein [Persephonella atlantica]